MAGWLPGGLADPVGNTARSTQNRDGLSGVQEQSSGTIAYGMEVNENYIVRVMQGGQLIAKGYVPETFQLSVQSRYGQPFGQGIGNNGALGNAMKVAGHTTLTSQSMTMQVWEGSEPLELQFEFEFLAEKDPYEEVLKPILKLLQLVMPSSEGSSGLLKPPGPQIQWMDTAADAIKGGARAVSNGVANAANNGTLAYAGNPNVAAMVGADVVVDTFKEVKGALNRAIDGAKGVIALSIGKFMYFDNVVIEAVNQTYHSMFEDSGMPLRATVAITFKTFMVPTVQDINKIFVHSRETSYSQDTSGAGQVSPSDARPRGGT